MRSLSAEPDQRAPEGTAPEWNASGEAPAAQLARDLAQALRAEGIVCCRLGRAVKTEACEDSELQLLVARNDMGALSVILFRLGFKQVTAPTGRDVPGTLHYCGYDARAGQFVHVHAQSQLMVGHELTSNYRLPIERPCLEGAAEGWLFSVASPEYEFVLWVIGSVLGRSAWDVMRRGAGEWKEAEERELRRLEARVGEDRVHDIMKRHLPGLGVEGFARYLQALQPGCSAWRRLRTRDGAQRRLRAHARRSWAADLCLALWRRTTLAVRTRVLKSPSRYRLAGGGAMIAIVGGDGSGKSTAVQGLHEWLSSVFMTRTAHLGKPAWSWVTMVVRAMLKLGQLLGLYPAEAAFGETLRQKSFVSLGYPWLLREACRARDRYWTYVKARRLAARGGLVILDRFPLPQIRSMDGPQGARFLRELSNQPDRSRVLEPHPVHRAVKALMRLEERYYHRIVPPELVFVLRVDPEIAAERRAGEDTTAVRQRCAEVCELNWHGTGAHVIDAGKPRTDVLTELKGLVWAEL